MLYIISYKALNKDFDKTKTMKETKQYYNKQIYIAHFWNLNFWNLEVKKEPFKFMWYFNALKCHRFLN